jgi:hypothetical protein
VGPIVDGRHSLKALKEESKSDVHEDYVNAYDLGRFAESARFVRHYPEQNAVFSQRLLHRPRSSPDAMLVPWSNNQYLNDLLPNSEIHPLDAGHFGWEQAQARLIPAGELNDPRSGWVEHVASGKSRLADRA